LEEDKTVRVRIYGVAHFNTDEILDFPDNITSSQLDKEVDEWILDKVYDSGFEIIEE